MQEKLGVTYFVSEIKRVEKYPDFEKLAHVIQHSLLGLIVKSVEIESAAANDPCHVLNEWVCCVNNFKCYQRFHKT